LDFRALTRAWKPRFPARSAHLDEQAVSFNEAYHQVQRARRSVALAATD
jgi:hypothetical protein